MRNLRLLVIGGACVALIALFFILIHPSVKFERNVKSVAHDPESHIGSKFELSTYPDDQPILGSSISSSDINRQFVWSYDFLSSKFQVTPITYYSEPGSMPTQETIWQYTNYFVRLYARRIQPAKE